MDQTLKVSDPIHEDVKDQLYPLRESYKEHFLEVSELHTVWIGEYGNPQGIPIIFLHGGPGGGCMPNVAQFYNPDIYRIILVDQRGCGKSSPQDEIQENTTQDLVADLEKIRKHLQINKWVVTGGSWGTTLALAYGQAHPESCLGFVLRGVFLAREFDRDFFWKGSKTFFPEAWADLVESLSASEKENIADALYDRIFGADKKSSEDAIKSFMYFDLLCSFLYIADEDIKKFMSKTELLTNVAKYFLHYFKHHFYLKENQLLDNIDKISHIPCVIVHGRYDVLCSVSGAFDLHQHWPGSELVIVSNAGHASLEPGVALALKEAHDQIIKKKV